MTIKLTITEEDSIPLFVTEEDEISLNISESLSIDSGDIPSAQGVSF